MPPLTRKDGDQGRRVKPEEPAPEIGSRPCRDPGAHRATAPSPPDALNAPMHGAKAKPADAGAGD